MRATPATQHSKQRHSLLIAGRRFATHTHRHAMGGVPAKKNQEHCLLFEGRRYAFAIVAASHVKAVTAACCSRLFRFALSVLNVAWRRFRAALTFTSPRYKRYALAPRASTRR